MSAVLNYSTYGKRDTMRITSREDAIPMKKAIGAHITYDGHVVMDIVNEETGEEFQSVIVVDKDGTLYATRSSTFIKKMEEIVDAIHADPDDTDDIILEITQGQSKSGRDYTSCALV